MDEILLQTVLDIVPYAILIVNNTGSVTHCNESAAKLFEYEVRDILGLSVENLVPPDMREKHVGFRQDFMKSPYRRVSESFQFKGYTKLGDIIFINISLVPVYDKSESMSVICIIKQVATSSTHVQELRDLADRLKN